MRLSVFRAVRDRKILSLICFGILIVMIVAAFWPFSLHPPNHATWLGDQDGLRFGGGGIVSSSNNFQFADSQSTTGVSLELWLEPFLEKHSTALLSFSSRDNPEQFRLRQSHDFLLIVQEPFATSRHTAARWFWIPHAFQAHKRRFIAISSGPHGATVYLDGTPAVSSSTFKITSKDLSGQLIVGSSPVTYDTWRGKLFGLALFGRELKAAEVSRHYQTWLNGQPAALKDDQPAALYTFAERSGSVAHNQVGSGPNLAVPPSYSVPYKPFLKSPWREFSANQAYFRDVFINIAGFVPFGFFFCMLFSSSEASRKAALATILLGGLFSLTIEVLQGFTPIRDSGTTDIITNTLGTALGVMLYRCGILEVLLGRLESRESLKASYK